ncbi:hypothetical protein D3C84_1056950 [compost metagenome]
MYDPEILFPTEFANTKAVVAIWFVLVPGAAVGAVGTPVKDGEVRGAYVLKYSLVIRIFPVASEVIMAFVVKGAKISCPFILAFKIDVLPIVVVLEPDPIAVCPIIISFVPPLIKGLVSFPI